MIKRNSCVLCDSVLLKSYKLFFSIDFFSKAFQSRINYPWPSLSDGKPFTDSRSTIGSKKSP